MPPNIKSREKTEPRESGSDEDDDFLEDEHRNAGHDDSDVHD